MEAPSYTWLSILSVLSQNFVNSLTINSVIVSESPFSVEDTAISRSRILLALLTYLYN